MFSQNEQVRSRILVFQRLGKINESKQKNIQVREQKKWKLKKKKKQQLRSFTWVCEQNEVGRAKHAERVNVVSIIDEEETQNFEFSCQETFKHQQIAMTNHEMCSEVQVNSPKSLNDDLTPQQKPS